MIFLQNINLNQKYFFLNQENFTFNVTFKYLYMNYFFSFQIYRMTPDIPTLLKTILEYEERNVNIN